MTFASSAFLLPETEVRAADMARALVGLTSLPAEPSLTYRRAQLAPSTIEVIEETLARGLVLALARRGGWVRCRHVVQGAVRHGRLWERHPKIELHVSGYGIELILWLAFDRPVGTAPVTAADDFLAYLAADLLKADPRLAKAPAIAASPFPWLAFSHRLADSGEPPPGADRFRTFVERSTPFLEALQSELAERALMAEVHPWRSLSAGVRCGQIRRKVLEAYLDAVEDRPDLARFLVQTASALVQRPEPLQGAMLRELPLTDRSEAARAVFALVYALEKLARRQADFRAVRFFEDDYDLAQLYLEDWSILGDEGYRRLRARAEAGTALPQRAEASPL